MNLRVELNKFLLLFFYLATISCSNKKLNSKIIENEQIKIEQYQISEISSTHEFLDLTNKRWNKIERIYEGNTNNIDSIYIKNDTIFLVTNNENPTIYELSAIKFGYKIELINKE